MRTSILELVKKTAIGVTTLLTFATAYDQLEISKKNVAFQNFSSKTLIETVVDVDAGITKTMSTLNQNDPKDAIVYKALKPLSDKLSNTKDTCITNPPKPDSTVGKLLNDCQDQLKAVQKSLMDYINSKPSSGSGSGTASQLVSSSIDNVSTKITNLFSTNHELILIQYWALANILGLIFILLCT